MDIYLKSENFLKNGLTDEEVLYLLIMSTNSNIERAQRSLINKGFITQDGIFTKDFRITEAGKEALESVLLDSTPDIPKEDRLTVLANKMREIFPAGRKGSYSWRGTTREITKKLQKFFDIFGDKYSDEEILDATQKYVTMNANNPYMRLLKYFILKNDRKPDAEGGLSVTEISDLADMLENGVEDTSEDWRSSLV